MDYRAAGGCAVAAPRWGRRLDRLGLAAEFQGNGFWWLVSVLVFPAVITASVLIGALLGGLELDVDMVPAFVAALLTGLF